MRRRWSTRSHGGPSTSAAATATSAAPSNATSATRAPLSAWGLPTTSRASGSASRWSNCRSSCSRRAASEGGLRGQGKDQKMSEQDVNAVPERVRFAYWVPNVSGGLVVSKIEQRTDWGIDYNRKLAVLAENAGFEYALSQVRYMASYGAEYQHESTGFSLALLLATQRLKVIAAIHPGL